MPKKIILNGNQLPWVDEVMHLGCTLQSDNSMKSDIIRKKCIFNNKINSLLQEFHAASPPVLLKCMNVYSTSFFGSPLWSLFDKSCDSLYKSWNVAIRNILKLDKQTHRYLIEPLSNVLHLKTSLCSRYIKFAKCITSSQKFTTRFLSNCLLYDGRSTFGKNIFNIIRECKSRFEDISPKTVKFNLKYWVPSVQEEIRIEMAKELMSAKDNVNKIEGFSQKEIMEMFTNICIH